MTHVVANVTKGILIGLCCLALAGCKEVLFSELDQTEANEMVAVLAAEDIPATRERDKDGVYAILVGADSIPIATTLLRRAGYPRPQFDTLGQVFSDEGIAGTPFEEHIRYIYALNEELSRTISTINGIQSARVFITAPPKGRYEDTAPPASASVTINYEDSFDPAAQVSKIKTVIAHSVPNIAYDDVAVALFREAGPTVQPVAAPPAPAIIQASSLPFSPTNNTRKSGHWAFALIGCICIATATILIINKNRENK